MPVRIYLPREKVTGRYSGLLFLQRWRLGKRIVLIIMKESVQDWHPRQNILCVGRIQTGAGTSISNRFYGLLACSKPKPFIQNRFILNVNPQRITLIGDSAGGNLAAAVSLKAREMMGFLSPKDRF